MMFLKAVRYFMLGPTKGLNSHLILMRSEVTVRIFYILESKIICLHLCCVSYTGIRKLKVSKIYTSHSTYSGGYSESNISF